MEQVESRPLRDHDPLTQDIWNRLHSDIKLRADGGAVTEELAKEVKLINDTGLDESAGEGWHRSCNHEKTRAPSSSLVHLKRTTRQKAILRNLTRFLPQYGERASAVLRYEWVCWKRVLQTRRRNRWVPKLMKSTDVLARVYREDAKASEDWSSVLERMPDVRPVTTEKASEAEKLQRDWLVSTLDTNAFYSVDHITPKLGRTVRRSKSWKPISSRYSTWSIHGLGLIWCTLCSRRRMTRLQRALPYT